MDMSKIQQALGAAMRERDEYQRNAEQGVAYHNGRVAALEDLVRALSAPDDGKEDSGTIPTADLTATSNE